MELDVSQFRDVFFEEAAERIAELETNVLLLESDASDATINAVFRAAHSIKGGSGTFGFDAITAFAHVLENVLERLRDHRLEVTTRVTDVVLESIDVLKNLIAATKDGTPVPHDRAETVRAALASFLTQAPPGAPAAEADTGFELFDAPSKVTPEAKPEPAKPRSEGSADAATLRVATTKLDQLVDLVGELVIAQSMLNEALRNESRAYSDRVREATVNVERRMRDLQERVLAVRMVPIERSFARFPRLVRDVAATSGKKIELRLEGGETELDKSLVERLIDPLTHLIRNAVDHGIEPAEVRTAKGKPESGTVTVFARAEGGSVLIGVRDDGRGLDTDKILRRAIERGLVSESQALSRSEIEALIFAPGFSTADSVSEISGRGVGMDVVKQAVEALSGSIAIVSELGVGTTMRLKLPLTLAMLDGMSVSVGSQVYVLPIRSIVESLRPRPEQIKTLLGRGEVLLLRGATLPLVRLHHLFSLTPRTKNACEAIIVVVENEGKRIALQIDDLIGEQQVVVKSLDASFQRARGVMAATVMGDGRVALIVDVPSIVRANEPRDEAHAMSPALAEA